MSKSKQLRRLLQGSSQLGRLICGLKERKASELYSIFSFSHFGIAQWLKDTFYRVSEDSASKMTRKDSKGYSYEIKVLFESIELGSNASHLDTVRFSCKALANVCHLIEVLNSLARGSKNNPNERQSKQSQELPPVETEEMLACQLSNWVLKMVKERIIQSKLTTRDLQCAYWLTQKVKQLWEQTPTSQKIKLTLLECPDQKVLVGKMKYEYQHTYNRKPSSKEFIKVFRQTSKLGAAELAKLLTTLKLGHKNELYNFYLQRLHTHMKNIIQPQEASKAQEHSAIEKELGQSFDSINQVSQSTESNQPVKNLVYTQLFRQKLCAFSALKNQVDFQQAIAQINTSNYSQQYLKQVAFSRVQHILTMYQIQLQLYGSWANGLAIQTSDIDVAVSYDSLKYQNKPLTNQQTCEVLEYIQSILQTQPWVTKCRTIKASTPVLKLKVNTGVPMIDRDGNNPEQYIGLQVCQSFDNLVDFDITLNEGKVNPHTGIQSTNMIRSWLAQAPQMFPVVIFLKKHLAQKRLTSVYEGGLNTYTLVVMVRALILREGSKANRLSSSLKLLQEFLLFYGKYFDEYKQGIDITKTNKPFYRKGGDILQIIEPVTGKIMTKNAFLFYKIKAEFAKIYRNCFESCRQRIKEHLYSLCSKDLEAHLGMSAERYFCQYYELFKHNSFKQKQ